MGVYQRPKQKVFHVEQFYSVELLKTYIMQNQTILTTISKLSNNSIRQILSKIQIDKNYSLTSTTLTIEGQFLEIPHNLTKEIQKLHTTQYGQTLA